LIRSVFSAFSAQPFNPGILYSGGLLVRDAHEITWTSYSLSLRERDGVREYNTQVISCMSLIGVMNTSLAAIS